MAISQQFYAGVASAENFTVPQHLQVTSSLHDDMVSLFNEQYKEFGFDNDSDESLKRVAYAPGTTYRLEKHEVFTIENFPLPALFEEASVSPHKVDHFKLTRPLPSISTLFRTTYDSKAKDYSILFQSFRAPQYLQKKFSILLSGSTFQKINHDGLSLAHELCAVYENGTLFFKMFPTVARIFDLDAYAPNATESQILEFTISDLFEIEDDSRDGLIDMITNDGWLSKRIASILNLGLLGATTAKKTQIKAKVFDIEIPTAMVGGKLKIKFPKDKKAAKQLVKFLNEEYYHGELSNERYETNSQRRLS